MKNFIRSIAKAIGIKTNYHVACLYSRDSHVSTITMSSTVTVKPWLHPDNYIEIVKCLHEEAIRPTKEMPIIVSITKIGI